MKKLICALLFIPAMSMAAGGSVHLDKVKVDVTNIGSLQRGAKVFANYCMGCHSLKFVSYGRLKKDLYLTEDQVFKHLMGTHGESKKLSDYMITSLSKAQGIRFYGKLPPDLSTISRARGNDWLYSYLRSFYVASYDVGVKDPKKKDYGHCQKSSSEKSEVFKSRQLPLLNAKGQNIIACKDSSLPFGVNNTVFEKVSMPHVMLKLQGPQVAKFEAYSVTNNEGKKLIKKRFIKFIPVNAEGLSAAELKAKTAKFDSQTRDLVTFLSYVGDPGKIARQNIGFWVILFLLIFTVLSYLMKKEFWRDIH